MGEQSDGRGPSGVEQAAERYGRPLVVDHDLPVSRRVFEERAHLDDRRTAEVLLLVRRPSGRYILHTKSFYPPGAHRLLTGGIHPGEDLVEAAVREAAEETGLQVQPERFMAVLRQRFTHDGAFNVFTTYMLELAEMGGTLGTQDPEEEISEYREVGSDELEGVAQALERLPDEWVDWGRFRALGHRVAAQLLGEKDPR